MVDDMKDISERLARLEKLVETTAVPRAQASDITPEDLVAFRKVRDVLAWDPDNTCGINECFKCVAICRTCQVCTVVCRVCRVCDFECTCGPCNIGGLAGRFGGLGE